MCRSLPSSEDGGRCGRARRRRALSKGGDKEHTSGCVGARRPRGEVIRSIPAFPSPTQALRTDEQAAAFLRFRADGVDLRQNYLEIMSAIRDQLRAGNTVRRLMGAADEPKLVSSVAYFKTITGPDNENDAELYAVCSDVVALIEREKSQTGAGAKPRKISAGIQAIQAGGGGGGLSSFFKVRGCGRGPKKCSSVSLSTWR